MNVTVIGVPFNGIQTPTGPENPAKALRQAGLDRLLKAKDIVVDDLGDLPVSTGGQMPNPETGSISVARWLDVTRVLAGRFEKLLKHKGFPLVLGGDCSLLLGVYLAFARQHRRVGLISLDGHADFHDPKREPDGDPAELILATLTGYGPPAVDQFTGLSPLIAEMDVAVYGIRQPDAVAMSRIPVFDRQCLAQQGIQRSVLAGLRHFVAADLPLWLHFDVDVLDPGAMPAVCFPEPGGLSFAEARELLAAVLSSGRVIGMDVACYHPALDANGQAGEQLVSLIADVLG